MATERETKKIKVGSHEVEIKTYLTGREFNEIEKVLLSSAKVSTIGKEVHVDSFSPTAQQDANAKAIELLVVSLDSSTDDIANRVLELPHHEYLEVIAALDDVQGKKKATGTGE